MALGPSQSIRDELLVGTRATEIFGVPTPRGEETSASAAAIVPPCRDTKVVFSNTLRDC